MVETRRSTLRSRFASLLQSHPVASFVALALAGSWSVWLPTFWLLPTATSVAMIPGAFAPALAAAAMVRVRGGSVRVWVVDGLDWRVGKRWYAVCIAVPIVLGLTSGAVVSLRIGSFDSSKIARTALLFPVSVVALALVGGGQEEFGWRGYALPALQERWSALTASVVVGVVWAVWHLPAFAFDVPGYTGSFALYTLLTVGLSIVFTWLYNNTGGSILLAMLLHGGVNAASGLAGLFVGDPSQVTISPYVVLVPLVWVVAAAPLLRYGPETLAGGSTGTETERPSDYGTLEVSR